MPTIIVDGQEIELADHERLNGIQVARRVGVEIPHYCWHPGLSVVASCRMCLVEAGQKNASTGEISMLPKLVPACQTPARDGTVFVTSSDKVKEARAMVEEDLLIRHPIDCPICDKAGECRLQDYHFQHGRDQRRADIKPFTSRRRTLGDTVTLFVDRCVMCSRCVRFCREVSGTAELMVEHRGAREEINVFPGYPLDNRLSGNVVDLCPVGALGDRDFLYSQRVWFMKSHNHVCAGCATGCSIVVDENQDRIHRLRPRENPHVNQWWMCDDGRYGWKHVHSGKRQTTPRKLVDSEYEIVEWPQMLDDLHHRLSKTQRIAAALSPHLTVEEAYLLATYLRNIDADAFLALGPVPVVGEDEVFSNGFTIRAEKCPNRRGVEEVIRGVAGELRSWDDLVAEVDRGDFGAVWITGGYKTDWIDEATAGRLAQCETLIVQDLFSSPLWQRATYQLPGAAFAERHGSFVNHADRLQSFRWALRPPEGALTEGQVFWRLARRSGLYNAQAVLSEAGQNIGYFAAAIDPVPTLGVELKVYQLA
jgi:NADH-quinone oxidoreductase subunit G